MPTEPNTASDTGAEQPRAETISPERDAQANIVQLLKYLDQAAAATGQSATGVQPTFQQQSLSPLEDRLGMVSALFTSLSCKHQATASHSLRVALLCSRWAEMIGMPEKLRVQLEAAALLHDIGKISAPDAILTKPGRLTNHELLAFDRCREAARQILTAAGAPGEVIEGVAMAPAWYDGTHRTIKIKGDQTPYMSRMIAIADAFDSMTSDQVYRKAVSIERATAVLFEHAGTQFDPGLVESFVDQLESNRVAVDQQTLARWFNGISPFEAYRNWPSEPTAIEKPVDATDSPSFASRMIENMNDAVIFVDAQRFITHWNPAAERLTGVGSSAACGAEFTPEIISLTRDDGDLIPESDCPVRVALLTGLQSIERLNAAGINGRPISIDMHVIPMFEGTESTGAVVMLHDASSEASLERRCRSLHAKVAKDPMTQVANRAEFDRMLVSFVEVHQEIKLPFSLVMADIDHFKKINDTFGHQAGDEAIIEFANLLKASCRSGDLVARYGGEEFAVLCADCNIATAYSRAEQIRKQLNEMQFKCLGGQKISASFGVTELQTGDNAETILRRADRGLLRAKDQGRNQVVQLGNGMIDELNKPSGWFGLKGWWFSPATKGSTIEKRLVTNVPIEMAVEKLKGFIADRDATIVKTELNQLKLEVLDDMGAHKQSERPGVFVIEIKLSQEHIERTNTSGLAAGSYAHTYLDVRIIPKKAKGYSASRLAERTQLMLGSLNSYVMAREAGEQREAYVPVYGPVEEVAEEVEA